MTKLSPEDPAYYYEEKPELSTFEALAGTVLFLIGGVIGIVYCLFPVIAFFGGIYLLIVNG